MTVRWAALAWLACLAGCGPDSLATSWPAEDGDLVFVLKSLASGESELIATISGRPTLHVERSKQESLFLVVVTAAVLRSLHYAVDLSPEALALTSLRAPGAGECATRVRLREQTVEVDFPADVQVFQLNADVPAFERSSVSAEGLLGFHRLQLNLGDPPCGLEQEFERFEPAPPIIAPDDLAPGFSALFRHDEVVFAVTPCCLYALRQGQPFARLNFNSFASAYRANHVAGFVTPTGELKMMVSFTSPAVSNAGALAWVSFDGVTPQLEAYTLVNEGLFDVAVGPQGEFAAVGRESRLFSGTVSSTIVRAVTVNRLANLTKAAFSDSGELAVSSDFEVARGSLQAPNQMTVTVLRENGVPIDTTVRGLAFIGEVLTVATSNDGMFFVPPDVPSVEQFMIGISKPITDCGTEIPCLGNGRFESNNSMAVTTRATRRLYTTHYNCPVMTVFDLDTDCAADIPLGYDRALVFASPKWLTVASDRQILQLPIEAL